MTRIDVFGTAMDMAIRRFPPSVTLTAGAESPLSLIRAEIAAAWRIASLLLRRRYLAYRNVSHARVIRLFADSLLGKGEYPIPLRSVLPVMELLEAIAAEVPAYRS